MSEDAALHIGCIGLGIMGRPMALNVLKAGFPVTAWNRSANARFDEVVAAGAARAGSPREVAARANVIVVNVTDSPDVEAVILGEQGVLQGARSGTIVVDNSTISPDVTRALAARLQERDVTLLDAPVSGGERGAIDGTLSIMVGGEAWALEKVRPILEAMGKRIVHCGPSGAGQTVKLCNQVVVGLHNLAMSEALVLAAKAGVSVDRMLEAVSAGAAGSWALSNLAPRVLRRDFAPGFKIGLQQKDLKLALEAGRSARAPLPGTALVHQLYTALEADGLADEGNQALVKALEQLARVEVRGEGAA
ncbi:MAG TPA: NAD(P)-binding domain-containing protein [Dehalococcoidia bacterium]